MANEAVVKVFHAARQDIEIIPHLGDLLPHPVFDTQVAAMVCGFGDSVSYDQLVAEDHRRATRQIVALHRLAPPAALRKSNSPTHWPTSRTSSTSTSTLQAELERETARPLAERGDGRPDLPREPTIQIPKTPGSG